MDNNLGQVVLVKDINPGNSGGYYFASYARGSSPSNFTEFNDKIYFTANDGERGNELWVSDGTAEGTNLLLDINPGVDENSDRDYRGYYYYSSTNSSNAANFTEFNHKLYFTADDGEHGNELWVSDGTAEGTHLFLDINVGTTDYYYDGGSYANSSNAANFTEFNHKLYFTANDGEHGNELWISDGTTEGTELLIDINPSVDSNADESADSSYYYSFIDSSYASNFTEFDHKLYFTANDGEHGNELWVSDGTAEGTELLIDINPGATESYYYSSINSSYASNFTEFNHKLYFTANDGEHGNELWVSDGTAEGTELLIDINPGSNQSYYYYSSEEYSYPKSSYADNFTEFNDKLYFTANDGEHGNELWVSDGTTEGTHLLVDINSSEGNGYYYEPSSYADNFTEFNDKLYFTANDGEHGNELWVSDGTAEGTHLLVDINSSESDSFYAPSSYAANFTEFNDKLYFTANDGEHGNELWVSDGTAEGTRLVADINPSNGDYNYAQSSYAANLTVFGDELLFSANNGVSGNELFKLTLDDSIIFITGSNNAEQIVGGTGADQIEGLDGKDTLLGAGGNDRLLGGDGKDSLNGGDGHDTLFGEDGKDILLGGAGDDVLTGGDGKDVFVVQSNGGTDTITDFDLGRDRLGLSDGLSYEDLTFAGNNIQLGDSTLLTLTEVDTANLTESDFFSL